MLTLTVVVAVVSVAWSEVENSASGHNSHPLYLHVYSMYIIYLTYTLGERTFVYVHIYHNMLYVLIITYLYIHEDEYIYGLGKVRSHMKIRGRNCT